MWKIVKADGTQIGDQYNSEQAALIRLGTLATRGKDVTGARVVEFDQYAARVQGIVAEIRRKPDAHIVLEEIHDLLPATTDPLLGALITVINAYFETNDEDE